MPGWKAHEIRQAWTGFSQNIRDHMKTRERKGWVGIGNKTDERWLEIRGV